MAYLGVPGGHKGGAVRSSTICLLAVAALAATAFGQTLEKTIWLPDSNVGLDEPTVVFHNPVTNRVYFTGAFAEYIQIYDANTHKKARRIDTLAFCANLVHCYREHEIWATAPDDGYIIVIDDRTDSMVALLEVDWPGGIAYNANMGKAYVLDIDWERVLVYDVLTRTCIDSIQLHDWPDFIVWDSTYNRVYVLGWDWEYYPIVAIDCTEDSIAEVVRGPCLGDYLLVHPARNKLYCLGCDDSCVCNQLWVYNTRDLSVDTVITLPVEWWCPGYLTLNPVSDILYAGYKEMDYPDRRRDFHYSDTIAVFDCAADALVGLVDLPGVFQPSAYCVNERNNKVYICSYQRDSVAVLGVPDSITGWIRIHQAITGSGWNRSNNEVYLAGEWGYVWILDGTSDAVTDEVDYEGKFVMSMTWSPGLERLYVEGWNGVGWLGTNDSLENWCWFDNWYSDGRLAFSTALDRLYFRDRDRMHVYDCRADSFVCTVQLPDWNCSGGIALDHVCKLYLPTWNGGCVVYDTDSDSVVLTAPGFGTRYAYQPANGLVYGWGYDSLLNVIDPRADTLVASDSGWDVRDLAVNELDNEAYFVVADHPADVFVIDGESNVVERFVSLGSDLQGLLWVDSLDLLACICSDSTFLVDCQTRQVVRTYSRGHSTWALDRTNSILYDHTPSGRVTAMHCMMDSAVVFDVVAHHLCWNETQGGMFGAFNNAVHVFSYDPVGIHSPEKPKVRTHGQLPTVVRGVLFLPPAGMTNGHVPMTISDITGRKVMDLSPGANDIRHVAPGVYFIRQEEDNTTTKVVIQR
jgi:DNA-binding beta-propeller fold protein YncE